MKLCILDTKGAHTLGLYRFSKVHPSLLRQKGFEPKQLRSLTPTA